MKHNISYETFRVVWFFRGVPDNLVLGVSNPKANGYTLRLAFRVPLCSAQHSVPLEYL